MKYRVFNPKLLNWRGYQGSCEYCGDVHYDSEYCDTCGMPPCRCMC
ncbi:hypothetical protein [Neisseria sp. DTU_2021_1001991_1_SI_NGA_ILE_055]|nr:hypothetical protein [Neisseria sp. DTU_2021_1001991_1_SI_NGA_ILE_055]WNS83690.1 hypothetical protein RRV97_00725 [Neisseria sp. DTU_2021_1001991_1_SI_NGA_ILE_055]